MQVRGNALETPTRYSPSASRVLDTHFQGPVRLPSMGWTPAAQSVKNQARYPPSLPNQVLFLILSKFVSYQFLFYKKHQSDSPAPDPTFTLSTVDFHVTKGSQI